MVNCPKCKAHNLETAVRCKWCGLPLARPKPQTPEEAVPSALPPAVPKPAPSPPVAQAPQLPPKPAPLPAPIKSEPVQLRPQIPITPPMERPMPQQTPVRVAPAQAPVVQSRPVPAAPSAKPIAPVAPTQPQVQSRPPAARPTAPSAPAQPQMVQHRPLPAAPVERPATPAATAHPRPQMQVPPAAPRQAPPTQPTHLKRVTKPDVLTEPLRGQAPISQAPARPATTSIAPRAVPPPYRRPQERSTPASRPLPPPPRDSAKQAFDMRMKMIMRCPGCGKKLEDGKFCWPAVRDGVIRLTAAQLSALLEGLDWRRVHAARETPAPTAPS